MVGIGVDGGIWMWSISNGSLVLISNAVVKSTSFESILVWRVLAISPFDNDRGSKGISTILFVGFICFKRVLN